MRPVILVAAATLLAGCGSTPSSNGGAGPSAGSASPEARCASLGGIGGSLDDHGSAQAAGPSVRIDAGDSYFQPTCYLKVRQGEVTITVHNSGSALHNLTVAGQGSEDGQDIPHGQTISVSVKVGSSPVTFFCKYHRTSGMQGALVPGG